MVLWLAGWGDRGIGAGVGAVVMFWGHWAIWLGCQACIVYVLMAGCIGVFGVLLIIKRFIT